MLLKGTGNPGNVRRVGTNGCERGKVCMRQRTEEDSSFERRTNVAEGVHDGDTVVVANALSPPSRRHPHPMTSFTRLHPILSEPFCTSHHYQSD